MIAGVKNMGVIAGFLSLLRPQLLVQDIHWAVGTTVQEFSSQYGIWSFSSQSPAIGPRLGSYHS